jgi:hypothetical protein
VLPPITQERLLPITPFLDGIKFEPETKRVMGVAFEMARAALRLGLDDPATKILAKRIIDLAKEGVLDPNGLCEQALSDFDSPPPRV